MRERIIIVVAVLASVLILVFSDFGKQGKYYNCRDAHWHPDYPIEVRKQCSELLYEEWKKQQNEKKNDPNLHEDRPSLLRT
jgi:hypothetical protein